MRLTFLTIAIPLLLAAGCGGSATADVDSQIAALKAPGSAPSYYLGSSFEGLPLTHVERGKRGSFLVYGDCDPSGSDTRCTPPLQLQVILCPGRKPGVAVFGDGTNGVQAMRALEALKPLNRRARQSAKPDTAVDTNPFAACFVPPGSRGERPSRTG